MEQLQTLPYQRKPLISATEQQREVPTVSLVGETVLFEFCM
jgi:hypothetical protein